MNPGDRLGPYEIVEQLGAGGMGEVWLATDTRLGRQVAVKVLPEEFASIPERLARFEQEARAAAALNHPHIATVYDIGAAEGVHFIVQERLQGKPLQEVLAEGRLPLNRALELCVEVAEALAAAHAAGIVHRDLKPANLFVSPEGHAKVLDFGLAKLTEVALASGPGDDRTKSPTMLGTAAGQVMGTAGYMAPEQVAGGAVDGRADVFAFGCVLYEMVTGRRPFAGRSVMQTLDMIVHETPEPLRMADARLPVQLQWILDKCLAKDRARRYQGAADLAVDLRRLAADVESGAALAVGGETIAGPSGAVPSAPVGRRRFGGAALLIGTAAVSAALGLWLAPSPLAEHRPVGRFQIALPEGMYFSSTGRTAVTVSRDGSRLAFSAGDEIWVREIGSLEAFPVRGTGGDQGGRNPVFSPDGSQIAFWADEELRRVPAAGGAAVLLTPASNPWGMRWEPDGFLYYGQGPEGVWRVSEEGGRPEQLVALAPGQLAHGGQPLADGSLLFTLRDNTVDWEDARVVVRSADGRIDELVNPARDGRLLPTGHLVYAQGDTLFAVPVDAATRRLLGTPVAVVEGMRGSVSFTATSQFAVSETGTLVYLPGSSVEPYTRQLAWIGADGAVTELGEAPNAMASSRVSSDGHYVVGLSDEQDVWVVDLERGTSQALVPAAAGTHRGPLFSPDGRYVVYSANGEIRRIPVDRSGPAETLFGIEGRVLVPDSFSADGTVLAGRALEPGLSRSSVFVAPFEPAAEPDVVMEFQAYIESVRLSPDGRRVAYAFNESGITEIFVHSLETGSTVPVSAGGGVDPCWSADGAELFFVIRGEGEPDSLMAVEISGQDSLTVGTPRTALHPVPFLTWDYDLASGAGKFLAAAWMVNAEALASEEIRVVTEWFDELRQRAPAGR